jgi:formate C-acetyltransferase
MDFTKLPNVGTLELKLSPALTPGESDTDALVALLRTFVDLGGGCYLSIDVLDADALLDAKVHPEHHQNLAVRISGWSARFVTLNEDWQDMIIGRTHHALQ